MKQRFVAAAVLLVALASCTMALAADQGTVVKRVRWSEEKSAGRHIEGTIVNDPDEALGEVVMLPCAGDSRPRLRLLTLEEPGVGPPAYLVRGRVRYEDVALAGYLEMLNYFPGRTQPFFTRTLAESGPLQSLEGTSDWRVFELPFDTTGSELGTAQSPTKLAFNLVLPKGGTVYLSDLELVQLDKGLTPIGATGWWSSRTAGYVGAIGGTVIGCCGGLIGTLSSMGRGQRFVMAMMRAYTAIGIVSLIAGAAAVALGQSYAVYYPLLAIGGITLIVFGSLLPTVRRRYQECEMRRMKSLDVA